MYRNLLLKDAIKRLSPDSIELMIPGHCNMGCKYCYMKYNVVEFTEDEILNSIDVLMESLNKEKLKFKCIELFGPELVDLKIRIIEKIVKYGMVIIPIGERVFDNDDNVKKLIYFNKNYNIHYSISMDGKYMESNRPNIDRNDGYYDKVFSFAKETNAGFHPMIYYDSIENWQSNFLWFISMFNKYNIELNRLYLLEVRNDGWTDDKIKSYSDFIRFLVRYTLGYADNDVNKWYDIFVNGSCLNIFTNCFNKRYKGLSCSIQNTLNVRLGDLAIFPCHRLQRDVFKIGYFDNNEIHGNNVEAFIATKTCDSKLLPYCITCSIKDFCPGQCLGSMYETNKNMFTPILSVCNMYHNKLFAIFDEFDKLGKSSILSNFKKEQIRKIIKFMSEARDVRKS